MKQKRIFSAILPLMGLLSLLGSGCSSMGFLPKPVASQRQGFLDRIEPSNARTITRGRGRTSVQEDSSEDSGPPVRGARLTSSDANPKAKQGARGQSKAKLKGLNFRWPLDEPVVTSSYGKRGRDFHDGLDLRAKDGTPVYAAQAGVVLYADEGIRGYGLLVVVRHPDKVSTIYAHNSKLFVRRGQRVKQGQLLSYSGSTGHVSGPHVHFEIRVGQSAVNPSPYLPAPSRTLANSVLSGNKRRQKKRHSQLVTKR